MGQRGVAGFHGDIEEELEPVREFVILSALPPTEGRDHDGEFLNGPDSGETGHATGHCSLPFRQTLARLSGTHPGNALSAEGPVRL